MTTKAIFPKAKSVTSLQGVRFRMACGGASHQWGFMFHRGLPADHGPSQVHRKREENHPMQTQLPRVPREHSGDCGSPSSPPSPPCLERPHTVRCRRLAGAWVGTYTCPCPLLVRYMAPGSINQQDIFFLTLDKSIYISTYICGCT